MKLDVTATNSTGCNGTLAKISKIKKGMDFNYTKTCDTKNRVKRSPDDHTSLLKGCDYRIC